MALKFLVGYMHNDRTAAGGYEGRGGDELLARFP